MTTWRRAAHADPGGLGPLLKIPEIGAGSEFPRMAPASAMAGVANARKIEGPSDDHDRRRIAVPAPAPFAQARYI